MLASAIRQESDSVFVDLLTYSDLETLKSKKVAGRAPLQRTIPPNNKRYLILTYAAEFDRVHYPLPLLYEEPTIEHLQSVVQQLKAQLGATSGPGSKTRLSESAAEVRRLRDENAALERQLAEAEQQACSINASGDEQLQVDLAQAKQEVALVISYKAYVPLKSTSICHVAFIRLCISPNMLVWDQVHCMCIVSMTCCMMALL